MLSNILNPFIGLRSFEPHESLLYFGRQEQTLELLKRLHQHHFVAVIGGSGSGKSSLVKAGLIPGLKAGYIVKSRDKWIITAMRPGQSPLRNLAEVILQHSKEETLTVDMLLTRISKQGMSVLVDVLRPLWEQDQCNFFLLVDQFEELFRFSLDMKDGLKKDEANEFVNAILYLTQQTDLPVYVVITMRSDFIGDCAQFYNLPETLNQSQYLVPRLTRAQLKSTIESPAALFGGEIHPNLTSRLLNDAQQTPDELPLLQHALMRIWQHEYEQDKNGVLDLADYERIGRLDLALSNHAEEAYTSAAEEDKRIIKRIFQSLTTIDTNGRKTRRPAYLQKLTELTGSTPEKVMELVNRFIEGNRCFLIVDKHGADTLVDISHESLIRRWSTLSAWVDEEQDSRKKLDKLLIYSELDPTGEKRLLDDVELQQLLKWQQELNPVPAWGLQYHPNATEGFKYLQISKKKWAEEKTKIESRRKWRTRYIVIGFAATIIAMAVGFYLYRTTKERAYANRRIENYIVASTGAYKENKDIKGLHLLAEALTLTTKPDTVFYNIAFRDTLIKRLKPDNPFYFSYKLLPSLMLQEIISQNTRINDVLFSLDEKSMATINSDGIARHWSLTSGMLLDSTNMQSGNDKAKINTFRQRWKVGNTNDAIANIQYRKQLLQTWGIMEENTFDNFGRGPTNYSVIDGVKGRNDSIVAIWGATTESDFDAASIWSTQTGEQVGNLMIKDRIQQVFIGKGNKEMYVYGDSTIQVWRNAEFVKNIMSDPDIPGSLFKLQAQVATGVFLEPTRQELQLIPVEQWKKLYQEFKEAGAAHYKECNFKDNNYWKIYSNLEGH